jgi:signal transduction histidine kinase
MKNSIRFKLIIWITGTLFIILSSSSLYLYKDKKEYELNQYQENIKSIKKQLEISLFNGFWQLDKKYISSVIESNMQHEYIIAIKAKDQGNLYVGIQQTKDDVLNELLEESVPEHSDKLEIQFYQEDYEIGAVEIYVTNAPLIKRIHDFLINLLVIEFVAIFCIGSILYFAMNRYIFTPIKTLEQALDKANTLDINSYSDEQDYELPALKYLEWSKVVNGVNNIINKIVEELHSRQFAEIDALLEKNNAETAYNELVKTKNSLVQTEKMAALGRLVAGIAHEINTPIGIALTVASHLKTESSQIDNKIKTGTLKKSQLDAFIDLACESSTLIFSNSQRASELIQSFKQIAVDQSSQIKREFLLCEYLKEVLHSLNPKIKITPISVDFRCNTMINMNSYPGALSQVITNLVLNAIFHAFEEGQSGSICIDVKENNSNVEIRVEDDGLGIEKSALSKIFDPFFTTKQGKGGTGLGLNIVFNIVTQTLNGTISVTSEVGHGSCFTINIPIELID